MSVKGISPRPIVMILSPPASDDMSAHMTGMTGMNNNMTGMSNMTMGHTMQFGGLPKRHANNTYDMAMNASGMDALSDARAMMTNMTMMANKLGFSGLLKKNCCVTPGGMTEMA